MKHFQRIFILFFAVWLLIGQVGFAFQSKKCLITGSKKWNISNNTSCCKRDVSTKSKNSFSLSKSSCCAYNQYVIKFNFSVEKLKSFALTFISTSISRIQFSFLWKKDVQKTAKIFLGHFFHPPSHSFRLAILQSYLI